LNGPKLEIKGWFSALTRSSRAKKERKEEIRKERRNKKGERRKEVRSW